MCVFLQRDDDMKITITGILIAAGLLVAIVVLLRFGLSDFAAPPLNDDIWETKPWRPWARVVFSFVMISLLIGATGFFLKVKYRSR